MENDQGRAGWKKKHINSDHKALFNQHNGYDGCMEPSAWNAALATWRIVSMNDGLCHVDTPEDDGGLDGIEERAYIFDKRRFTAMDGIGVLDSMRAVTTLQPYNGHSSTCYQQGLYSRASSYL